MFLGWYDPDKKKTVAEKLAAAIRRYEAKWGHAPAVALVNPAEVIELDGLDVQPAAHVAPNTYYVGAYEAASVERLAA